MDKARRQVKGEAVSRELLPGTSPGLLKELHLLTRDGQLNADSLRKLKQVNHLVRLLQPAVEDVLGRFGEPVIADCGAGKGYLGFILAELFVEPAGKGTVLSIETRAELTKAAEERAGRLGYRRMRFVTGAVESAEVPERLHLVTALHACDTATDDALALAIRRGADHVAVVPCCQAEVARQLEGAAARAPLDALFAHPWHRREFGSHLTNVVRALALEAHGYRVTVTELAGWEHSLKNELILAKKVRREGREARARLESLLEATGVRPKLIRSLAAAPGEPPAGTPAGA
ncbi:class I SAM-dependent methyltransferase [Anaeromyxobacter paludicola]|uniref:SAM-dependent methyltransferase n=1 Tax=Anaeromyxobacter paludicola TaxID=2918171 RepID=A0ABN6N7Z6_9BACT|nr:SAM-dependent methyltransferase [Anaeromyxobacter paludicola]BDG09311.1 SAM-dependent methyltransferase [Anaeromyxobacter paludicola]